jgi:hypothetical protein
MPPLPFVTSMKPRIKWSWCSRAGGRSDPIGCGYLGGKVPFGFRRGDDSELVPHEAEQEAIAEMVALWAQGRALRAIAGASRSQAGAHFGCGAGAPPEVPGGGTTFGSPTLGAGFSMAGSTSFGWMTPFDWSSFLLRFWAGAVGLASPGVVSGLGAWANAEPATSVTPATNRQSREPMAIMRPLNWLMCSPFPGSLSTLARKEA